MNTASLLIASLGSLVLVQLVDAAVISTVGAVQFVAPPGSANQLSPAPPGLPAAARVWNERFDFQLGGPLRVDATLPGVYDHSYQMGPFYVDRFEHVSSHFIHVAQNTGGRIQGSVTFDNDILGVICIGDAIFLGSSLDESDFLTAGTIYPDGQIDRGLEIGPAGDRLHISSDRRTLSFWLDSSTSSDSIRVITAVPAPGPLALAGLAVLTVSRRRR